MVVTVVILSKIYFKVIQDPLTIQVGKPSVACMQ